MGFFVLISFDLNEQDSESDDGDDAASSDAASRSPSPADLERSSYSPDAPVALTEQPMMGRAGGTHTTTTTTHSGHHQVTAGNSNQLSSRILNHPSGSTTRGSAGKSNFPFLNLIQSSGLTAIPPVIRFPAAFLSDFKFSLFWRGF